MKQKKHVTNPLQNLAATAIAVVPMIVWMDAPTWAWYATAVIIFYHHQASDVLRVLLGGALVNWRRRR